MEHKELLIQRVTDFEGIDQFECGIAQMDKFLHEHLADCSKSHYCTTYFVRFEQGGDIVALFALSNDSVDIDSDDFDGQVSYQFTRRFYLPKYNITTSNSKYYLSP